MKKVIQINFSFNYIVAMQSFKNTHCVSNVVILEKSLKYSLDLCNTL